MPDTFYAMTAFKTEIDDYGIARKMINAGDTVTRDELNVSKEEWQGLIDNGSISTEQFIPDDSVPGAIPGTVDTTSPDESYKDMTPAELKELADTRSLEVTRADGNTEKDPTKKDYITALEQADANSEGADE